MNIKQTLFLAYKFLTSSNTDKTLFRHIRGSIIGIALSLVPLIVVLEVTDGMISGITRRYIELGSFHFQARTPRGGNIDYEQVISDIKKINSVVNAFTFIEETCLVYTVSGRLGVSLRGLPENLYEEDKMLREFLVFTDGEFVLDSDSILLSGIIAEKINAKVGDEVRILTVHTPPGRPPILRPARFVLKGIFTTGYRELDEISAYIQFERAASIFRDTIPIIGIKVEDPYKNIGETLSIIRNKLPPNFFVNSWHRINYTLHRSLEITKNLLFFIMILILCVASINISSTMIMMVLSMKKEIAILKSIGFSQKNMALTFLLTGFGIGIVGSSIGMVIGIFISLHINIIFRFIENIINIFLYAGYYIMSIFRQADFSPFNLIASGYYLEEIPIVLDYTELVLVFCISLLLSVLASFLPAYKAGAIRPIEIIQKS
ncbi:MAG: FtsX-like permease family protein [Spirochaetaceae bacterium]|nr:FtsX-like permease family protein [Spirochaetaceae bacterium]